QGKPRREPILSRRRLRLARGARRALDQAPREEARQETVVEAGERGDDRQVVEEREVAACNQKDLEEHEEDAGGAAQAAGPEGEPRSAQLRRVIGEHPRL